MSQILREKIIHISFILALCAALLLAVPVTKAQGEASASSDSSEIAGNTAPTASGNKEKANSNAIAPLFTNYKGVTLGMSADDVRRKLDGLKEKSKEQDFFIFSDNESAQVYYDTEGKVMAVSLNYVGEGGNAPDAKAVLGEDVEAKADGSIYKLVRYPEAGYWVSYSRTAGNAPLIIVTMQKIL
jgi:hypothetical protein